MSTEPASSPPEPEPGALDRETLKRAAVATVLVLLIGLAFVWSYVGALHEPKFHGVELAVAGPAALAQRLDASEAFSVTRVPTRAAAVRRIDHRQAFGGVVATPSGFEVLTAQAAGVSVATGLESDLPAALRAAAARGARVTVTDVRPLPHGACSPWRSSTRSGRCAGTTSRSRSPGSCSASRSATSPSASRPRSASWARARRSCCSSCSGTRRRAARSRPICRPGSGARSGRGCRPGPAST